VDEAGSEAQEGTPEMAAGSWWGALLLGRWGEWG
jgi:hypothetical protein